MGKPENTSTVVDKDFDVVEIKVLGVVDMSVVPFMLRWVYTRDMVLNLFLPVPLSLFHRLSFSISPLPSFGIWLPVSPPPPIRLSS